MLQPNTQIGRSLPAGLELPEGDWKHYQQRVAPPAIVEVLVLPAEITFIEGDGSLGRIPAGSAIVGWNDGGPFGWLTADELENGFLASAEAGAAASAPPPAPASTGTTTTGPAAAPDAGNVGAGDATS